MNYNVTTMSMGKVVILLTMLCCFVSSTMAVRPAGFLMLRRRGHCTPQYWGSRREEWPKTVPQRSTISKIFGSRAIERFRSNLTLLEATIRNDVEDVYIRLLKQSTAALLNSYARLGFPYRAWEVKIIFLMGLISEKHAAQQAHILKLANEACT